MLEEIKKEGRRKEMRLGLTLPNPKLKGWAILMQKITKSCKKPTNSAIIR